MADHRAEQIMTALLAKLQPLATTGYSVHRARVYALTSDQVPGISLFMGPDEPVDDTIQTWSQIDSQLTVYIDAHVRDANTAETDINRIRKEVVLAIMADYSLGLSFVLDAVEGPASEPERSGEAEASFRYFRALIILILIGNFILSKHLQGPFVCWPSGFLM